MKNPLKHIQETRIWMRLWEFFHGLRDLKQVRQFWRHTPLIRQLMSRRLNARRTLSVRDYVVSYGEGSINKRADAAKVSLHGFHVGDAHDSTPPGPPGGVHLMRDIVQYVQRPVSQVAQELTLQGLTSPRLSDLVDYLAQHGDTVQPDDPVYAVSEEQASSLQSGRLVYRILRAQRTARGLTIDMPHDLPHRKCDNMLLLPAASRVLGISIRPIGTVTELSLPSRSDHRTSEPA